MTPKTAPCFVHSGWCRDNLLIRLFCSSLHSLSNTNGLYCRAVSSNNLDTNMIENPLIGLHQPSLNLAIHDFVFFNVKNRLMSTICNPLRFCKPLHWYTMTDSFHLYFTAANRKKLYKIMKYKFITLLIIILLLSACNEHHRKIIVLTGFQDQKEVIYQTKTADYYLGFDDLTKYCNKKDNGEPNDFTFRQIIKYIQSYPNQPILIPDTLGTLMIVTA
jgi:hypothetical protein